MAKDPLGGRRQAAAGHQNQSRQDMYKEGLHVLRWAARNMEVDGI